MSFRKKQNKAMMMHRMTAIRMISGAFCLTLRDSFPNYITTQDSLVVNERCWDMSLLYHFFADAQGRDLEGKRASCHRSRTGFSVRFHVFYLFSCAQMPNVVQSQKIDF